MHRVWLGIVALLVLGPALWAADDPKDKGKDDQKGSTAADQYRALMADFQKARQELVQKYNQAKTEEEKEKILEEYMKKPQEFVGRFLELAKKNPKDKAAFDSLTFVVTNASAGTQGDEAADLLVKDYFDKLEARFCQQLARSTSPAGAKVLRDVLEKSKDHKVQGTAALSLGQQLKSRGESPDVSLDEATKLNKEAEGLLDKVVDKYADVPGLEKQAKELLFEVRTLAIGKKAPEIQGEDIDGKKFKLSDYRGKVVVLDFWGNW